MSLLHYITCDRLLGCSTLTIMDPPPPPPPSSWFAVFVWQLTSLSTQHTQRSQHLVHHTLITETSKSHWSLTVTCVMPYLTINYGVITILNAITLVISLWYLHFISKTILKNYWWKTSGCLRLLQLYPIKRVKHTDSNIKEPLANLLQIIWRLSPTSITEISSWYVINRQIWGLLK